MIFYTVRRDSLRRASLHKQHMHVLKGWSDFEQFGFVQQALINHPESPARTSFCWLPDGDEHSGQLILSSDSIQFTCGLLCHSNKRGEYDSMMTKVIITLRWEERIYEQLMLDSIIIIIIIIVRITSHNISPPPPPNKYHQ
jgi:hypothetical protein